MTITDQVTTEVSTADALRALADAEPPDFTQPVVVTEPVYEWDCPPVLAITDEAKAAAATGIPAARQSLQDGLAAAPSEPF